MENLDLDVDSLQLMPGTEAHLLTGNCGPVSCQLSCTVTCTSTD